MSSPRVRTDLLEIEDLRLRLEEAEETLCAIRTGRVDAVVVHGHGGDQVFTLRGADRPYRVLVESMSEGAGLLEVDGTILYGNRRLAAVLQHSPEQIVGRTIQSLVPDDVSGDVRRLLEEVRGGDARVEIALPRPVLLSARRMRLDEHPVICLLAADLGEQRRAERLDRILAGIADAHLVLDDRRKLVEANRAAREQVFLGQYPVGERPALGAEILRAVGRARRTGEPEHGESWCAMAGRWFEFHVYPHPGRHELYLRDISERRRAEEAKALLAAIVESSDDALFSLSTEGAITSWNGGAARLFGRSETEAIGRTLSEICGIGEDLDRARIARLARQRSPERIETACVREGGVRLHVALTVSPVRDSAGRVVGASVVGRDITERRLREERATVLSEATAVLAASLDYEKTLSNVVRLTVPSLGDGCIVNVVGETDDVVYHVAASTRDGQPVSLEIVKPTHSPGGVPPWRIPRTQVPELFPILSAGELDRIGASAGSLAQTGARSAMLVPLSVHDRLLGTMLLFHAGSGRRYGPDDLDFAIELGRRCALAIENARHFRAAQEAIRAREQFMSIASHELRTPLTALQLHLQLLQRHAGRPLDAAVLEQDLSKAVEQGRRLAQLITQLLDVSRLTSGRLPLTREPVDLVETVRGSIARLQAEPLVELDAPASATGAWDRLRLEQVVTNLLTNAIKYGNGHPVRVAIADDGAAARVSVSDRGIGMSADFLKRIFQPFERDRGARDHDGLGLGLYIARQIVESHGGRIDVRSAPGSGTTFTVVLPKS